jgi:single-stranded DNA-binding protein
MGDTNLVSGIVRILEPPKEKFINQSISVTAFRVQFPQVRQNYLVHLKVWGNLARDVANYYKMNDYILIEGYISTREIDSSQLDRQSQKRKKVEITILKVYPFLLSYDQYSKPLKSY